MDVRQSLRLALEHFHGGRLNEAERICRDLLELEASPADAWHLLGAIAQQEGDRGLAVEMHAEAVRRSPETAEFHNSLGIARAGLGQLVEAEEGFRRAAALKPDYADAHNNLGNARRELGQLDKAERSFNRALALRPDSAEAHANLGLTLRGMGKLEQAERSLRRAVALNPADAGAQNDLGATLFGLGRLEEAEGCYRKALALDPALGMAQGNLVFLLNFVAGRTPAEIFAAHRDYARRFAASAEAPPHRNVPSPERRLRVGYVSGDLREHPVGFFIEPVLARHDPARVEVFCYYSAPRPDAMTSRLKALPVQWRDVFELDDDALEALIREDGIDILVDLSGHTTYHRLGVFARKPAPVQATWLGYLNTTGLAAMDYRLTDAQASPEGLFDAFQTEKLLRLPGSQWCYQAPPGCPEVQPPPSAASGKITFAAFANPAKIGAPVIELWARLLARVPGSQLLVVANGMAIVPGNFADRFTSRGIARDRLHLVGTRPFHDYLALHQRADIVLDTFPYAGGTTTCHALWMGVPVVTLVGDTAPSRGGASLLHAVGLDELIATTPDHYLEIAAGLAGDGARLAALRAGLRGRMLASPLMDADGFTRGLEEAYRGMWRTWCEERARASFFGRIAARLRGRAAG